MRSGAGGIVGAWLVPGAGHLWAGRLQKGIVFLFAIPIMFVTGLLLKGTIFPFQFSEPLAGLAALAQLGNGLPWVFARMMDAGAAVPGGRRPGHRARRLRHCHGAQVTDHLLLIALFSFFVSLVFAVLMRDEPRAQVRLGSIMFAGFLASALILGWLMYPLPL